MSSRLVEASASFLNSHKDWYGEPTPMGNGMTRDNNPYAGDTRPEDEALRPVNLIRQGPRYDITEDGLLHEARKLSHARALRAQMYEMRAAVEYLENNEAIERQLDEQDGGLDGYRSNYGTNRNTLRPGGGVAHGLDSPGSVTDLQGRQSAGAYGGGGDDFLDPQQAENLAKLVSMRRESERNNLDATSAFGAARNLGGGNFSTMARHLQPAPAETGVGARVGQENLGPQPAHHDGPYKAGSAFDANRALVSWLTRHLPGSGGRNDSLDNAYGQGFDGVQHWDAPELQTSDRHDRAFTAAQHALPTKDTDDGDNEKAFGRGRTQAGASSQHYRAHMDIGARRGGYGDTGYDPENGDQRPGVGWERNAF
jgi:hypothetical protein